MVSLRTNISELSPSALLATDRALDGVVRQIISRYEPALLAHETDEYNLRRFWSAAFNFVSLFRMAGLSLHDKTMVEIGCGRGLKGLAWGDLVGRYLGIDSDPREIALGRRLRKSAGRPPDEMILGDACEILSRESEVRVADVGVLVLYAVLEHLTPRERETVLGFARACFDAGALVLIAETPNRLLPFDHHSSHKHFVQMLPDALALRYLQRFPDHPVSKMLCSADADDAEERLYRSGRAMSYHDFEMDFCRGRCDLQPLADGYHPALLDMQPPTRSELTLQQYFDDNSVGVPRAFSRAWIDMLLSSGAAASPRSVRLNAPEDRTAVRLEGREFWNIDRFVPRSGRSLSFRVDGAEGSRRAVLLLDAGSDDSGVVVSVGDQTILAKTAPELRALRPPTWHSQLAIVVPLPAGASTVRIAKPSQAGTIMPTAGLLLDV